MILLVVEVHQLFVGEHEFFVQVQRSVEMSERLRPSCRLSILLQHRFLARKSVLLSRVAYSQYSEIRYRLHGTAAVKKWTLMDSVVELHP